MNQSQPSRVEKIRCAKACTTCRRKKVKCDGRRPVCSTCHTFGLTCAFQDVSKESKNPSRAYVEGLEQKLRRMENELKRRGPSGEPADRSLEHQVSSGHASAITSQAPGSPRPQNVANNSPGEESGPLPDEYTSLASDKDFDQPSYVLQSEDGKMRFYGASSGFSAPYSETVGRNGASASKVAGETAAQRSAKRWPLTNWIPRVLQDPFEQRRTQNLPPKEATLALVNEFLTTFNQAIPLVNEKSFLRLVERQFSWNPDDNPSSWALLNVVLGFSYRERAQTSSDESYPWKMSLAHIKNALNVVIDLFLRNADLSAVQALLGLALYFQGTPNAQALFMFSAAAMRLSHSIGLHRNTSTDLDPSEIEQRRRTYWIAFILDADISLRVGRPPVQDMEDHNIPLPASVPPDRGGIICIAGTEINFLRLHAQLALLQRRVYRHFQILTTTQQSRGRTIKSAMDCEAALVKWRDSIPEDLRPRPTFISEPNYFLQHLLRMHLAYHCCCANLRQLPKPPSPGDNSFQDHNQDADIDAAGIRHRSLASARSAVALLPYVRSLGSNYKWHVLYFFATASVALASEVASNPSHELVHSDLQMVREAVTFLTDISSEEPSTYFDFILGACSDVEKSARRAIRQTRPDIAQPSASRTDGDSCVSNSESVLHGGSVDLTGDTLLHQTIDPQSEPVVDLMNPQWSIPPFWSWQDTYSGLIPSLNMNEGRPEDFI
ncbi:hypothetical protein N7520_009115 [Penicillium odoratum]|uniref:uncharacterized protein n=1 Tax=Penicillium odoratum TaxID=1167516 RepID=UPI002548F415|nr:uncharacterized protein N7520_009115 [Penicillium odoratum]KAJ5752198.1 hypothetical protein N7520_009115 [Penicillium odoratum]